MIWKRSNWLGDLVIPLLVAVLWVCWLAPWLEVIRRAVASSAPAPVLPAALMLAVLLVSIFSARLLLASTRHIAAARLGQATAGFAAILFVLWWQFYSNGYSLWTTQWLQAMKDDLTLWQGELPGVLIAVPVVVHLWLRGTLDAQASAERIHVWGAFATGFVALLLCIAAALASGQGLPPGMSGDVFTFFAVAMAGLALSSIESTRDTGGARSSDQVRLDRYWLASVASVIVALLAIGLLFSLLITPDVVARAFRWTSGVLDVVGRILYAVLLVVAYLVFLVLDPFIRLLQGAMHTDQQAQQTQSPDLENQLTQLHQGTLELPHAVTALLPWIGLAVVILLIGLVFALALRQLQRRGDQDVDETRELILSRDLLGRQLAEWRLGLGRNRNKGGQLASPYLALDGEVEARRRIRHVYQMLLQAMSARGRARQPGQTPAEYQQTLEAAAPAARAALATMTDAYTAARYSPHLPQSSTVDAAQKAWDELEASLAIEGKAGTEGKAGEPGEGA